LYTAGSTGHVTDSILLTDSVTGATLTIPVVVFVSIVDEPFTHATAAGWTLGLDASLTGNGTIDADGAGWLRVTTNVSNVVGYAYFQQSFDLSRPLVIELDFAIWGTTIGEGADGFVVALFDAAVAFQVGGEGSGLGYQGMAGAYAGIALSEYKWPLWYGGADRPNTVGILGSAPGYAVLGYSAYYGALWFNQTPRPDQSGSSYRHLRIEISAAPNPTASVWVTFGAGGNPTQMVSNVALPAIATSQLLKLAITGSAGWCNDYHEVRNVVVSSY